jgi:hypothetical protein
MGAGCPVFDAISVINTKGITRINEYTRRMNHLAPERKCRATALINLNPCG